MCTNVLTLKYVMDHVGNGVGLQIQLLGGRSLYDVLMGI
jgi:hypothetical protein